ncbi:hypothetical protein L7F22_048212 [Adiantum nelumboides]|nr:hypothetical protein [Adiantum nelumboides]
MLFSATQTTKVQDLARISLRPGPLYINVHADLAASTVSRLEQGYVVCDSDKRFLLLFTFLKRNKGKKVIVFMSSCNGVKYHAELLNYIDVPVLDLHGKQKQQKRTATFFEFCNAPHGILLCTDVAARGLDIPKVDWIIQFDPPDDPRDYIHRVGRTARAGKEGKSLMFLLPSELGFLRFLKVAKVPLNEYQFPTSKVANVQGQLEKLISKTTTSTSRQRTATGLTCRPMRRTASSASLTFMPSIWPKSQRRLASACPRASTLAWVPVEGHVEAWRTGGGRARRGRRG